MLEVAIRTGARGPIAAIDLRRRVAAYVPRVNKDAIRAGARRAKLARLFARARDRCGGGGCCCCWCTLGRSGGGSGGGGGRSRGDLGGRTRRDCRRRVRQLRLGNVRFRAVLVVALELLLARLIAEHQSRFLGRDRTRVRVRALGPRAVDAVLADRFLRRLGRQDDGRSTSSGGVVRVRVKRVPDPPWSSSSCHGRSSPSPSSSGAEIRSLGLERRRIRVKDTSRSSWSRHPPTSSKSARRVPSALHRRDRASLHLGSGLSNLHHLRGQATRERVGGEGREGNVGEEGRVSAREDGVDRLGDRIERRLRHPRVVDRSDRPSGRKLRVVTIDAIKQTPPAVAVVAPRSSSPGGTVVPGPLWLPLSSGAAAAAVFVIAIARASLHTRDGGAKDLASSAASSTSERSSRSRGDSVVSVRGRSSG